MALVDAAGSASALVHDVEFWESESGLLTKLALDDIFDDSPMAVEGEAVSGHRLENIVRRCLREVAWLELAVEPRLLIHFGYDMRIFIASTLDLLRILDGIRSMGLFVYDSNAALPTLDTWALNS